MGPDVSVDRDELAGLILDAAEDATSTVYPGTANYLADELLAAGYRKPRTIASAEELDALPARSVIVESHGLACQKHHLGGWLEAGGRARFSADRIQLPATVAYIPENS